MKEVKVVIFDADHTLYVPEAEKGYKAKFKFLEKETGIPSEEIRKEWEKIMEEVKNSPEPEDRRRVYSTRRALKNLEVEDPEELARESVDVFLDKVIQTMVIREGAKETLSKLKEKYELVVASDEFEGNLKKKLNSFLGDWEKYFEFMVTPETTGRMKPSEKYYEAAKERTGFGFKEMVMVGDSWERDLEPAKDLGIETVLVGKEREGEPDHLVESLEEIEEIVGD